MAIGGGNLQKPMETSSLMSSNDSNLNVFEKPNKINKNIKGILAAPPKATPPQEIRPY